MANKKTHHKRYFLNPREGVAAASSEVSITNNIVERGRYPTLEVDAGFSLSDCNRQVHLDFDIWVSGNKKRASRDIKDLRQKLQRLKIIVDEFVEATNEAYDQVEEHLDAHFAAVKEHEKTNKK